MFGLKESPSLWWLELRDAVLSCGFVEVPGVPGFFALFDDSRCLIGLLGVRVDDGTWAGHGSAFKRAQDELRKLIKVKVEKNGTFEILGRRLTQKPGSVQVDQFDYVKGLRPVPMTAARRKQREAKLTPQEVTQYLSITQQLAWPARTTMPRLAYLVSYLQQRTPEATVADLTRANWVLRQAQEMGRQGDCLMFKQMNLDLKDLLVVSAHDASFGKQTKEGSQQGHVTLLAGTS